MVNYIGIPTKTNLDVNVRCLCNWVFAPAKITMFKAKVISRVNVEYQFARYQNTVCNFVERWNTYNVLGKMENDNIVFNL